MKRLRTDSIASLAAACLIAACAPSQAAPATPTAMPTAASAFDLSYKSSSPVADALGGSYLLSLKGPEAGAANPSQVNNDLQPSVTIGAVASDSNIDVNKAANLINQLSKLKDNAGSMSVDQGAFNDVWNYAGDAGASVNGGPAKLSVNIDPVIGASLGGRWALIGESKVQALANISRQQTGSLRTLSVAGGAIGLTSAGIAFAAPVNSITYGLFPKIIRADYVGYGYSINDSGGSTDNSAANKYVGKQAVDLDAGASMNFIPSMLDGALVVRHIFFPSFTLDGSDVKLKPEVDLGVHGSYDGLDGYAEAHNLSATNVGDSGAGVTGHFGLQKNFANTISLRTGFDDGKWVYGVGLKIFAFCIDLSAGSTLTQRAGISASFKI